MIDEVVLKSLIGLPNGKALLLELCKILEARAPALLDDMEKAIQKGDSERFRRLAHALKSTACHAAGGALTSLCHELETSDRLEDDDRLLSQVTYLRVLSKATSKELSARLAAL